MSESLLKHFIGRPLVDSYDIYQHLMDYWAETMQDDCYLIATDGWKAETYRIIEKDKKGKEKDKGWACDLVPKLLIVAHYFAKEQAAIDQLEAVGNLQRLNNVALAWVHDNALFESHRVRHSESSPRRLGG